MSLECRRVVTGHTSDGKSTVLYDSRLELLAQESTSFGQEDRSGTASRVFWTTRGFPVDNDDPADTSQRQVHTSESDGTVLRIVEYRPGVSPRHHRTGSIDYAVVLSGSLEIELDTETVELNAGDILIQRGTIHNWINNGNQSCLVAFVLIGARPVMINGKPLEAKG